MPKKTAILVFILFFSFTSYSFAIHIDFNGPIPDRVLTNKVGGGVKRQIIAIGNTPVYKSSNTLSEIAKAEFRICYYVGKETGDTDDDFTLLVKDVDDEDKPVAFLGWVQNKNLISRCEAIRNELKILKKILIINKWRLTKEGSELESAILREGPGMHYKKSKESRLFRFFYLYKELKIDGKRWFLIGPQPSVTSFKKSILEETIYGWIPEHKIFIWETREAIQFNKKNLTLAKNPRKTPAKIYESFNELERVYLDGEEIMPLSEEDLSGGEWEYHWMRYPLLQSEPFPRKYKITDKTIAELKTLKIDTKKLEEDILNKEFTDKDIFLSLVRPRIDNFTLKREKEILKNSEYGEYLALNIGYIGDQIVVSDPDLKFSAHDGNNYTDKIDKISHEAQTLDILFVVDATGSMRDFFGPTCDGIKEVVREIRRRLVTRQFNPTLRFSVLFYRDYQDLEKEDSFLDVRKELNNNNEEDIIKFINQMESYGGGDEPEAVFYALYEQLSQCSFKEGSFRILIHIGDAGNHIKDKREFTAEKVAKLLKEKKIHLVVGMNVSGNPLLEKNIEDYTKNISNDNKRIINARSGMKVKHEIINAIFDTAKKSKTYSLNMAQDIREGGTVLDLGRKYGNSLTERFVKRMEEKGIDPKWYSAEKVQIFDQGWILQRDIKSNRSFTETMLLLSRNDVEKIIAFLNTILSKPVEPNTIKEIWLKQLELELGETLKEKEKVSDYMTRVLGIPVRHNLLKYNIDEFGKWKSKRLEDLTSDLRKIKSHLRDVNEGRKSKINEEGKRVSLGSVRRFWGETTGADIDFEYIWMNKEELP